MTPDAPRPADDRIAQLERNPHFLQIVNELVADPQLLARLEAGEPDVLREASNRAADHFLLLTLRQPAFNELARLLSDLVYDRIRKEKPDDRSHRH